MCYSPFLQQAHCFLTFQFLCPFKAVFSTQSLPSPSASCYPSHKKPPWVFSIWSWKDVLSPGSSQRFDSLPRIYPTLFLHCDDFMIIVFAYCSLGKNYVLFILYHSLSDLANWPRLEWATTLVSKYLETPCWRNLQPALWGYWSSIYLLNYSGLGNLETWSPRKKLGKTAWI